VFGQHQTLLEQPRQVDPLRQQRRRKQPAFRIRFDSSKLTDTRLKS